MVDLAASKRFYEKAFGLPAVFETENSAVQGIELLNGPIDRWWGPRTASFSDLDGHVWEIATHVR